jgi:hypothetical protein
MKSIKNLLMVSVRCGCLGIILPASAQTWTQTSAPGTNWQCIASSADGKTLVAAVQDGEIYASTNSGVTWQKATNAPNYHGSSPTIWSSVAASADGTKLAAISDWYTSGAPGDGSIFTSTNSGAGWTRAISSIMNLQSIGSSAQGNKLTAVVWGGKIYFSTNSGTTWTQTNAPIAPNVNWASIASSADGSKLAAVVWGGGIYVSTNSIATWTQTSAPSNNWASIASSADGTRLAAAVWGGGVYTSTNSGTSWISNSVPVAVWSGVAGSADGTKLVAVATNGLIFTSTNSGTAWRSNNVPTNNWWSVASSADGTKLAAVVYGGDIYTSYTVPKPSLCLAASNSNLAFSWIMASTNFVLQKISDLSKANWATMTNTPVLNLTNLQNQIILPSPGSNVFYRLKTP